MPEYEYSVMYGQVICLDCGAMASTQADVEHFPGCEPGSSERWKEFYNSPEPEEEEETP